MKRLFNLIFIILPTAIFASPMMKYFNLKKTGRLTDVSHTKELLLLLVGFIILLIIIYIIGKKK